MSLWRKNFANLSNLPHLFQDHFCKFINGKSGSKFETWLEILADVCSHALYRHVPTVKRVAAEEEFKNISKKTHGSSFKDDKSLERKIERKVPVSGEGDNQGLLAFVFKQLYAIEDPKWFARAEVVLLALMNKTNNKAFE